MLECSDPFNLDFDGFSGFEQVGRIAEDTDPAGVPVEMTSPERGVWCALMHLTSSSASKMNSAVLECCFDSPTHHSPHLVETVRLAAERGLEVPVVWNCRGYERAETLELLDCVVDTYMPDVKWSDGAGAATYSEAPGYWQNVQDSLREMHRQVGDLEIDAGGLATGNLLVRHLVMPGHVENAKGVLSFVAEEVSEDTFVNVMAQYWPHYKARTEERYDDISRDITPEEYAEVLEHAREAGLERLEYDLRMATAAGV